MLTILKNTHRNEHLHVLETDFAQSFVKCGHFAVDLVKCSERVLQVDLRQTFKLMLVLICFATNEQNSRPTKCSTLNCLSVSFYQLKLILILYLPNFIDKKNFQHDYFLTSMSLTAYSCHFKISFTVVIIHQVTKQHQLQHKLLGLVIH